MVGNTDRQGRGTIIWFVEGLPYSNLSQGRSQVVVALPPNIIWSKLTGRLCIYSGAAPKHDSQTDFCQSK